MSCALELKTKMLLCKDLYYLMHVGPGAAFDAKTMSSEMTDRDISSGLVEVPLTVVVMGKDDDGFDLSQGQVYVHLCTVQIGVRLSTGTSQHMCTDICLTTTVKLCLSPGLSLQGSRLRSPTENTGMLSDWRHALVRYSISKQEEPGAETGIVETICNAVVLLESKN